MRKEYQIKLTGREGILYKEGSRFVRIHSELYGDTTYDIMIDPSSIKIWEPDGTPVSEHERQLIRARLSKNIRGKILWGWSPKD